MRFFTDEKEQLIHIAAHLEAAERSISGLSFGKSIQISAAIKDARQAVLNAQVEVNRRIDLISSLQERKDINK